MARIYDNEGYYKRLVELQDKLRKSEEERLKLEEKFNQMMRTARDSEQMRLKQIRERYNQFLEEDRLRNDRNEKILRILNQIESRAAMLTAKTDRLRMLRRQYENYILKNSPAWKNKTTENVESNLKPVTYENQNPITQSQVMSTSQNVPNLTEYNTLQYVNTENSNYNKSQVPDNSYYSNIQPSLRSAHPSVNLQNYDGNTFENKNIELQNIHKERIPIQQNLNQNLGQEHFRSGSVLQNSFEPLRNPFAKPFQTRANNSNNPLFDNSMQSVNISQPDKNQFSRVSQFQNYPEIKQKYSRQEENETPPISIQNLGIKTDYLNRAAEDNNKNRQSELSNRPTEVENTNDLAVIREYLNKDKEEETPKITLGNENSSPRKYTDKMEMYENVTNDTVNLEKNQNGHEDIASCHGNEKKGMINNFDSNNLSEVQNISHVDKISSGNDTVLQDQNVMGIMNLNATERDKKLKEMTVHPSMKSKIVHINTEQDNSDDVLFINANQGDRITELKAPTLETSESKPNLLFENEISRENIDTSIAKDKIESDYSVHRNYAETELVEGERILISDTKDKNNSENIIRHDINKKSDESSNDMIKPTNIENKDDQTRNIGEYENISEKYVSKNKEENVNTDRHQEAEMYQKNVEEGDQPTEILNEHETELIPDQGLQEQQLNTGLYEQEQYPGDSQQQYQNNSQEEQQNSGIEQYQEQQEYQGSEMQEGYDQQYTTDSMQQQYEQGVDGQYFQDENYSGQGQGSGERFDNYYEQGSYPQEYEQTTGQGYEQPTEQISEQVYDQTDDQNIDQGYEQSTEQTSEQVYEQTTGQIYDQSSQQAYDQTTGQLVYDQPYDQNAGELYSQYDQTTGERYEQMYDPVAQQTYDQSNYDTSQYDQTGQEYVDPSQGQYVDPNQIYDPSQESAVTENVSEISADGQPVQYESQAIADPLITKQLPPLSKMLDSDSESVRQPPETKPLSNEESDFDFSSEVTQ